MTSSELRPFLVPYQHVIAGWTCVLASHLGAWAVWKVVVGIPFAPWLGLVQAAYVIPLYFGVSQRWSYVGHGVKRAGQATFAAWAFYWLLLILGMFGGSK